MTRSASTESRTAATTGTVSQSPTVSSTVGAFIPTASGSATAAPSLVGGGAPPPGNNTILVSGEGLSTTSTYGLPLGLGFGLGLGALICVLCCWFLAILPAERRKKKKEEEEEAQVQMGAAVIIFAAKNKCACDAHNGCHACCAAHNLQQARAVAV